MIAEIGFFSLQKWTTHVVGYTLLQAESNIYILPEEHFHLDEVSNLLGRPEIPKVLKVCQADGGRQF